MVVYLEQLQQTCYRVLYRLIWIILCKNKSLIECLSTSLMSFLSLLPATLRVSEGSQTSSHLFVGRFGYAEMI